jgi:hypothetical protein
MTQLIDFDGRMPSGPSIIRELNTIQGSSPQIVSGNIQIPMPAAGASLPSASAALQGQFGFQIGGSGVADTLVCCMKNSSGTFTWTVIATGT